MEPLYSGHFWDSSKCPDFRSVLISEAVLYTLKLHVLLGLHVRWVTMGLNVPGK